MLRFPNVQRELVADLVALLPGPQHVGTETPVNLADVLPFVRVVRRGGPRDRLNDTPSVDIDAWDITYAELERLVEQICERIVGPPPSVWQFDRVEIPVGPQELPWGDGSIRRIGLTAQVVSRRYLDTSV